MRRQTLIAGVIALTLMVVITAFWSAETTLRDGDPEVNMLTDAGSAAGIGTAPKKGIHIARIVSAPFRAVGRLFGRGKDRNQARLQRLTEQDVAKFESAAVDRVEDVHSPAKDLPNISATARQHLAAGKTLLEQGRINEAISELSLAASLDARLGEANNLLGVAFNQKGMPARAKQSYERAVRSEPNNSQALNNLGFSLYESGNYRAAVDRLKRAAKLSPRDERILNNLALAQCRLGKFDDAFKSFSRAGSELNARLNTAAMLERAGHNREAIRYYEAARRLQPDSSMALRRLEDLYRREGRVDEAEAARASEHGSVNESVVAMSAK